MQRDILNPPTLARPSGYAHGVRVEGGRLLFIAGQTGMDASGRIPHPGDLVAQFRQALANIQVVVNAAGGELTDIVRMTIYVTDKALYQAQLEPIGAVYRSYFGRHYPALALIEVKGLWDDAALIEIESTAVLA